MNSPSDFRPKVIALSTVGSTGDIQPFIALALELQSRGHQVRFVSHWFHQERVESYGITFEGCGPQVGLSDLNNLLEEMISTRNPLRQLQLLLEKAILEDAETYYKQAQAALSGADWVVSHMVDFLGQAAAKKLGLPCTSVVFTHAVIPTPVSSPALVPNIKFLNPLSWKLMAIMMKPLDRKIKAKLESIGAPILSINRFGTFGNAGTLIAASGLLSGVPDSVLPSDVICTGPWHISNAKEQMDAGLADFLERHPSPVVVSLGSMGGNRGQRLTDTLLRALDMAGLPAVIQSGYAGLKQDHKRPDIHFTGFVSHEYLFPRALCVVHHGGAGTTAAACRAGVPSVVVAFIADQPYFGQMLKQKGLSPGFIMHQRLTPKKLSKLLVQAAKPAYQLKAREMRESFMAEDGLKHAADALERQFKLPNPPSWNVG
jgi:UDP:flavonoid glycosyltransferase YjiC (YdhE family)